MKAYRLYVPCFKKIKIGIDVTFEEDETLNRSRHIHSDKVHEEELEDTRVRDIVMKERTSKEHEDYDMTEPQRWIDPPREVNTHKRVPTWA